MKLKTCRVCQNAFSAFATTQVACSPVCALELAKTRVKKKKAKETRQMKKAFNEKDRSHQLKLAQQAFNAFIRERDKQSEGCISCGSTTGRWTAGHLRPINHFASMRTTVTASAGGTVT